MHWSYLWNSEFFGRQQKGYATLTEDQAQVVQYVFTDTVKATPEG